MRTEAVCEPVAPAELDLDRMGAERLARLREQMHAQGVDGAVLLHGPTLSLCTHAGGVSAAGAVLIRAFAGLVG